MRHLYMEAVDFESYSLSIIWQSNSVAINKATAIVLHTRGMITWVIM